LTIPAEVLAGLPTPCLIIDTQAAERNIQRAAACVRDREVRLRPHFKAHKCTRLMRQQLAAAGCAGVTCQTSWEALTLARSGFGDVLVAAPVVSRHACAELAASADLAQVTIAIDDPAHVALLAGLCEQAAVRLGVLIERNVGLGRCGLPVGSDLLIELARSIQQAQGLNFRGLQAHEGHVMLREDRAVRRTLVWQAQMQVRHERDRLTRAGIGCEVVSDGGTGTLDLVADGGVLTEIQAGSYVLMDARYCELELPFEPALFCAATMISRRSHKAGVLNAGLKALSADQGPHFRDPGVRVLGLSDEHARVALSPAHPLELGDTILLVPSHLDPTINLHDTLLVYSAAPRQLVAWPIDGRRGRVSAAVVRIHLNTFGGRQQRDVPQEVPVGSSGFGLAVMRHHTEDRLEVINRVAVELDSDRHVSGSTRDDHLMKVAVANDEVPQPTAVDVAALGGQGKQGRVYQQLLVHVAVAA